VLRPEIGIVSVSTNGLRLAREPALVKALAERGVVVALQLDGHSPATYARLRGRGDLAEMKRRLVDEVIAAGGRVSLTLTLARGVNEAELGSALDLLLSNDGVMSLMVQPLAALGPAASPVRDALDAITIPEVVERLVAASKGALRRRRLNRRSAPCSTCDAGSSNCMAASVGCMPCPERTNSASPVSSRSRRSCALTAGWVLDRRKAARDTLRSVIKVCKTRMRWRSMVAISARAVICCSG